MKTLKLKQFTLFDKGLSLFFMGILLLSISGCQEKEMKNTKTEERDEKALLIIDALMSHFYKDQIIYSAYADQILYYQNSQFTLFQKFKSKLLNSEGETYWINADTAEMEIDKQLISLRGNVIITNKVNFKLSTSFILFDRKDKSIETKAPFTLLFEESSYRGQSLRYNIDTKDLAIQNASVAFIIDLI